MVERVLFVLKFLKLIKKLAIFIRRRMVLFVVNTFAVPPEITPVQLVRCWMMQLIGFKLGPGSQLSEYLYVYDGRRFRAGANCCLGSFCRIWDFCPIIIGDNLLASHGLTLISGTHFSDFERTTREGPITLGCNVWIGINVTIVGPCTVGDNVIIGANSLVLGDLESNCVYGGSPAKLIRKSSVKTITQEHP
jgi:acetyltransferase-like isoleucine patch superfamily enzyme